MQLEELFWLCQGNNGFSKVVRASDDPLLQSLVAEGDLPGALWKQGFFKGPGIVMELYFMLERAFDERAIKNYFTAGVTRRVQYYLIKHEGKQDLEKSLPRN